MTKRKMIWPFALLALLLPLVVGGQTQTIPTVYSWTAPTTGSPVHHYNVWHKVGSAAPVMLGTTTGLSYTVPTVPGVVNLVYVEGVDAANRTGVPSPTSDPFTPDAGPPGAPGKPVKA